MRSLNNDDEIKKKQFSKSRMTYSIILFFKRLTGFQTNTENMTVVLEKKTKNVNMYRCRYNTRPIRSSWAVI